jgi:hypothetical protein
MLEEFLSRHRAAILSDWFEHIVTSYPPETARFLREQQDPFANPVGAGLRDGLGPLFDSLVASREDGADEEHESSLDRIVRVRAVQDHTPSSAVAFIFELKELIRSRVEASGESLGDELLALETKIDRLALEAFDLYAKCREQIFDIRVKEIRNLSMKQMERLNEWRATRDSSAEADVGDSREEGGQTSWAP